MATKLIGVKEFRQGLASYAQEAQKHGTRFIVLNKNKPLFEVRPLSSRDMVLEKFIADIAEARAEAKAGHVTPLEDVMREFGFV